MKASGNNNAEISNRLREFRLRIGLKQDEAAARFEIAYSTYKRYEGAKIWPDSEVIAKMVDMGLNANWLLTGEGEMLLSDNQARPALSDKPNESKDEELLQAEHELEAQEHVLDLPVLRTAITLTEEVAAVQALSVDQRAELILNFYTRLSRQSAK